MPMRRSQKPQCRRVESLGPLRKAHPASGATFNVQVVKGKMSEKCLLHACRALTIGVSHISSFFYFPPSSFSPSSSFFFLRLPVCSYTVPFWLFIQYELRLALCTHIFIKFVPRNISTFSIAGTDELSAMRFPFVRSWIDNKMQRRWLTSGGGGTLDLLGRRHSRTAWGCSCFEVSQQSANQPNVIYSSLATTHSIKDSSHSFVWSSSTWVSFLFFNLFYFCFRSFRLLCKRKESLVAHCAVISRLSIGVVLLGKFAECGLD